MINPNLKTHALILLDKQKGLFCFSHVAKALQTSHPNPLWESGAVLSKCYASIRAYTSSNGRYQSHFDYNDETLTVCSWIRIAADSFKAATLDSDLMKCDCFQDAIERILIVKPSFDKGRLTEYHLASAIYLIGGVIPTASINIPFSHDYTAPKHMGDIEKIINIACQIIAEKPSFIISDKEAAISSIKHFIHEYVAKPCDSLPSSRITNSVTTSKEASAIYTISAIAELLSSNAKTMQTDKEQAISPLESNHHKTEKITEVKLPSTLTEWKLALGKSLSTYFIKISGLHLPSLNDLSLFLKGYTDAIDEFNCKK
ncbi:MULTISPECIES: hypothetical protein [Aeromonas]|uniref:hypothetical protein n=1 Tax=Aeromonas TaxID=642 RepID=UPI002B05C67A|nr:hypothetical protein [Aeromonas jandaei]